MWKFGAGAFLVYVVLMILGAIGWVMNIVTIVHTDLSTGVTAIFVVRIVGIFLLPLGGVLGWF